MIVLCPQKIGLSIVSFSLKQSYSKHYAHKMGLIDKKTETEMERIHFDVYYRYLAREARDAGYPVDFGTFNELNSKGQALVTYGLVADRHHYDTENTATFRDGDPSQCHSMFTGATAVPLWRPWLELESCAACDIVGPRRGTGAEVATVAEQGDAYLPKMLECIPKDKPCRKPVRIISTDTDEACSQSEACSNRIGEETMHPKRMRTAAR